MKKRAVYWLALILIGALLVSCGSETQTLQAGQAGPAILLTHAQLAEPSPIPTPESASSSDLEPGSDSSVPVETPAPTPDHAVIQYGHPDLITDDDSALLTYIRYPQADGFADAAIAEWARETHENARQAVDSLRETDPDAEGEINIHFDSYVSPDGGYAGVIEQGILMDTGLAHPEDVIQTFNLDLRNQTLLRNADILDYARMPDLLALLRERLRLSWPESADYAEEADEAWLDTLAVGPDGVIIVLERGVCLPAYLGSVRVTLPYDALGDLLLIGGEPDPVPETPPATPDPETQTPTTPPSGAIDPAKPMIALTFDDGPSKYTPKILDLLERYGGRATFCVIGNLVDAGSETVKRAADMGCDIVGHSWDHRNLSKLSAEEIRSELADTNSVIESVIGSAPRLYRPPYGAVNDTLKAVSREMDLWILYWSVDTLDWKTKNADAVYRAVMEDAADRAIVLNHDLYGSTAEAMARIIPELIDRGYQLVTVSELLRHSGISPEAGTVYRSGK